ncbi:MAG TPA: sugar transferase [Polyangia bacterium]|nr:sugar transferase [Polyangia bacterium]
MTRDRSIEQVILIEDVLLMIAALPLAHLVHARLVGAVPGLKPPVEAREYAYLLLLFLPTWVIAAERIGIHLHQNLTGPRTETIRLVLKTQMWGVAVIAVILVAAQTALNRSLIAIFMVLSTVILLIAKAVQRRWVIRHLGGSRALLVGEASDDLASEMQRLRGRRIDRCQSLDLAELGARFRAGPIDEVVLAPTLPAERIGELVELCAEAGLPAFIPIDHGGRGDLDLPPPAVEAVGHTHFLVYYGRRTNSAALLIKAMLDRVLAAVLIVALAPLILAVAVLVRIFLGRPVLYVQRRGGLYGRPFSMLKFRTMRLGAEQERADLEAHNEMDGPVFKMANDPRVTRLGRVLRRTSLDELPQLFNVLRGHMSLVGPRPLVLPETQALHGGHRRRLAMRPGLTCLWQVSGRNDLTFDEWMKLDLEYIDTWSLALDFAILLRTLPAIVTGRGAR